MAKKRAKKPKQVEKPKANSFPKIVDKLEKKKKRKISKSRSVGLGSESDSPAEIQNLLEPFSRDQLINIVADLCLSHDSLFALIQSTADLDISHRKLFVHGLGWDANDHSVESAFAVFGEIVDMKVVMDRNTGKCKGYGFITFQTRKSAQKALKCSKVKVGSRLATCQLASAGASAPGVVSHQHFTSDFPQRKIYVSNVPVDATAAKLRTFFEKFGEIENGPTGLDPSTGKFRGYAIFVFKTVEGAKKVLEEPDKLFEGNQLHCRKAAEGKGKGIGGAASITTAMQPVEPHTFEAVAAAQQAQNMALFGQQMGMLNPLYGAGLFGNANFGALMGGYYGMMGGQMPGMGLGAYGVPGMEPYAGAGQYSGAGHTGGVSSGDMLLGLQHAYAQTPPLAKSTKTADSNK